MIFMNIQYRAVEIKIYKREWLEHPTEYQFSTEVNGLITTTLDLHECIDLAMKEVDDYYVFCDKNGLHTPDFIPEDIKENEDVENVDILEIF